MKYLIITLDDGVRIREAASHTPAMYIDTETQAALGRLEGDTGADIQDIADQLKRIEICGACSIEGQAHDCMSLWANRLGRRLNRLLERARGERAPGEHS